MAITETVYIGRDNGIDLLLNADGSAQNLTGLTRVLIKDREGVAIADSTASPTAFDWSTAGAQGILKLFLGGLFTVPALFRDTELILYDSGHPNGICWGKLNLKVERC